MWLAILTIVMLSGEVITSQIGPFKSEHSCQGAGEAWKQSTGNAGVLGQTQPINLQTGTSYAIATTDAGKLVQFSNASAVAVSLSAATTTGFTAGFSLDVQNLGAGAVTITPSGSTINGGASLVIAKNQGCTVTSDGTNYQISAFEQFACRSQQGDATTDCSHRQTGRASACFHCSSPLLEAYHRGAMPC